MASKEFEKDLEQRSLNPEMPFGATSIEVKILRSGEVTVYVNAHRVFYVQGQYLTLNVNLHADSPKIPSGEIAKPL